MNPKEHFEIAGEHFTPGEILRLLAPFLSEARRERIAQVVQHRITTVVPVLEGLYDRGNASAVLRSAEGMGYQRIHIIDSSQNFKEANRVTQGAEKWLDVQLWEATRPCLSSLKENGYRILATHLDDACDIQDEDFSGPTALIFGNEREGVSPDALELADASVKLPMIGFSQSFNISVAAALCLFHIREERFRRTGAYGDLDLAGQQRLQAQYYFQAVQHAERILLDSRVPGRHRAAQK